MLLNAERTVAVMEKRGLDALIAAGPTNFNYASDVRHANLTRSQMFVVLLRNDVKDSALLMPLGDIRDEVGVGHTWIRDVRPMGKFLIYKEENTVMDNREEAIWKAVQRSKGDALTTLVQTLKDKGLTKKTIGLDESGYMKPAYEAMQSKLEKELGGKVEYGFGALRQIRMIKTREELKRLKKCAQITEEAISDALDIAKVGTSGREIVRTYMQSAWEKGAFPRSDGIGLGRLAFLNNRQEPAPVRLKKGDLIRFDVSCVYESYYSDIARIGVVGAASPTQKKYYAAVKAGADAAIEAIRPGVRASQIFKAAVEGTRRAGIPNFDRSHCGHGIGIEIYDEPIIYPDNETELEENMVINVENPYYSIGYGAAHVEDTVLVTRKGCQLLSTSSRDMRVVG